MGEVLFVSKPVAPPWNDSSKNLVRDVSSNLERHEPVFVRQRGSVGFSPSWRARVDVLRSLLFDAVPPVWHFFFAPNWKSSTASQIASMIRRARTVHTVCSVPHDRDDPKRVMFADCTVVLSRWARQRFLASGAPPSALRVIPPCVPPLAPLTDQQRLATREECGLPTSATLWMYPGDLEFGGGAEVAIEGFAAWGKRDALLLMACRNKSSRAEQERDRLSVRASRLGVADRVRWIGETPRIHQILGVSDFVVMPNRSPYAKMDYPLVLLEAMSMGRPVFVGGSTPAAELAEDGGAIAVETTGPALAEAIEGISNDRAALDVLSTRASTLVARRFAPKRVAAEYERLYEELDAA